MTGNGRERFVRLLSAYRRWCARAPGLEEWFRAARMTAFEVEYRKLRPKSRRVPKNLYGWFVKNAPQAKRQILDAHDARGQSVVRAYTRTKDWLDGELRAAAEQLAVEPGPMDVCVRAVFKSDYHTQGFGAETYARGAARATADHYIAIGLPVDVVRVVEKYVSGAPLPGSRLVESVRYEVIVHVASELDAEIAKRKPVAVDLVQQVANYWARGVNPRVYMPFLPHDFESQHGIAYNGVIKDDERTS